MGILTKKEWETLPRQGVEGIYVGQTNTKALVFLLILTILIKIYI